MVSQKTMKEEEEEEVMLLLFAQVKVRHSGHSQLYGAGPRAAQLFI